MSDKDKRISALEFIARCKTAKDMCIGPVEGLDNGISLITTLQDGGFTVQLEDNAEEPTHAMTLFAKPKWRMYASEQQFNLTAETMITLMNLRPTSFGLGDDHSFVLSWD